MDLDLSSWRFYRPKVTSRRSYAYALPPRTAPRPKRSLQDNASDTSSTRKKETRWSRRRHSRASPQPILHGQRVLVLQKRKMEVRYGLRTDFKVNLLLFLKYLQSLSSEILFRIHGIWNWFAISITKRSVIKQRQQSTGIINTFKIIVVAKVIWRILEIWIMCVCRYNAFFLFSMYVDLYYSETFFSNMPQITRRLPYLCLHPINPSKPSKVTKRGYKIHFFSVVLFTWNSPGCFLAYILR